MRIQVSAQKIELPHACACCMAAADAQLEVSASQAKGKRVVRTTTKSWSFPYCRSCLAHVRVWESASYALGWIVLGVALALFGALKVGPVLAVLLLVMGAVGGIWHFLHLRAQARAMRSHGCCETGRSVAYLGWNGAVQTFSVQSRNFAIAFMRANRRKLVNVAPDLLDALEQLDRAMRHGERVRILSTEAAPMPAEVLAVPVAALATPMASQAVAPAAAPPRRRMMSGPPDVPPAPRPQPPARPRRAGADGCWIPRNKAIKLHGYSIPGGMMYVGDQLLCVQGRLADPALIDPNLPIDRSNPDRAGIQMSYWPSYSEIPPASRAAYLEWLAGGRQDPSAGIGLVFLYFYGLERRLLADTKELEAARAEAEHLLQEVRRLLGIYGSNASFRSYASTLLDVSRVLPGTQRACDGQPPLERFGYDLPLAVRVALGQFAAERRPIPPRWALSWFLCLPETRLRAPVARCMEEFGELFQLRYAARLGDGLVVQPGKRTLSATYRPASRTFSGELRFNLDGVPEVAYAARPNSILREIAGSCYDDLLPFARRVSRHPDGRNRLEAIGLLPEELIARSQNSRLAELRFTLDAVLGGVETGIVAAEQLLGFWTCADPQKPTKSEAVGMAQLLSRMGFGVEPDVRFGGPPPQPGRKLVLFTLLKNAPTVPSSTYAGAALLLDLGAAVIHADGVVTEAERDALRARIDDVEDLSDADRARLRAHAEWLFLEAPSLTALKRQIGVLDASGRDAVAEFLISIAAADGKVGAGEVKLLGRMYGILGLDPASVYGHLHALAAADSPAATEPVTVQPAGRDRSGFAIPPRPPSEEPTSFRLDMSKVHAKRTESELIISRLASTVFVDDEPVPSQRQPAPSGRGIAGLDQAHSALLVAMSERSTWSAAELEEVASRNKLILGGALETINEAAIEAHGDPLTEGDDPIELNQDVLKEMIK